MTERATILIVGCGYLGARVGTLLLARGARVAATTRSPARLRDLAGLGFEPEILDLSRPDASAVWARAFGGVVWSVAPGRGGDARLAFREGPIACARKIAGGPGPAPVPFVFVSSTGVYAEDSGGWVDERSPAEPAEERLPWLREGEDALRDLSARGAVRAAIVRSGGLYGPGRSPLTWLLRPEMRASIARGRPDAYMNWIRVEDAAEAAVLALERGRPGEIYDAFDGEPVRRADFYGLAAELAGAAPLEFAGSGGLGKRVRGDKARAELGFRARFASYREGLRDLSGRQGQTQD
ncbi:MAG: NAD-dependent epimerase/dehydratase family protein [Planctomycetota bacterium]